MRSEPTILEEAERLLEEANRCSTARQDGQPVDPVLSEVQFQLVWKKSTDGMRLTDSDGRIVMVNDAFCRMVGMASEDLVGQPFSVVYRQSERDRVLETGVARFAARAIEPHLERTLVLWNGRRMAFEASNSFIELKDRAPLLLSIFRDVTDRRIADDALRHAKEYSENLIAGAPVLIAHLDRFGRIKTLNETAERVSGYRLTDLDSRNWARLILPRRLFPEVWAAFLEQRRRKDAYEFEAPLITRSGEERRIRWNYTEVREDGRVVGLIAFGSDVTDARSTARVLQRYELLLKHASDMMLLIGPGGDILEANEAAAKAYGYTRAELMAMNTRDLCAGATGREAQHGAGDGGLLQAMHRRRSGAVFPVEVSSRAARVGVEDVTLWVLRDITERRAAEAELERQAFHDPLTGLANRALFLDRLSHALAGTARRRDNAAVLFVDLDRFKIVNDSLGHEAGDELLVAVARRLAGSLRAEDTAGRFGGDEFTILLENLADESEAVRVTERILQRLSAPFHVAGRDVFVTASVGIAFSRSACCRPEDLLRSADIAMYEAKSSGRSGYVVFRPDLSSPDTERLDLESDLRQAIERGELQLHFQPIMCMRKRAVVRLEALVRWLHPRHGLIAAGTFVPLQEQIGMADALTAWVLEEAIHRRAAWLAWGRDFEVSVNLSSHHLLDWEFPEKMRLVLERTGARPEGIRLEVSESAIMPDPNRAMSVMRALEQTGFPIDLDNFGAGYSSLARLRDLPVDAMKIDRSLVTGLSLPGGEAVVRAAVDLAHTLGRAAVAEGVESRAAWDTLAALGCDAAQGYYTAAPMPPDALTAWLTAYRFPPD